MEDGAGQPLKFLKGYELRAQQSMDRLSLLPDRILLQILSSLTLKQAGSTCCLSKRWRSLWRYVSKLNFEDLSAMEKMRHDIMCLDVGHVFPERSCFRSWVNLVLEQHAGEEIDEFRVAFDLDKSSQSDIDKWVDFTTLKSVKRLVLNLKPALVIHRLDPETNRYVLPPKYCCYTLISFNATLISLCLNFVNVTAEAVEGLLNSSQLLENLQIENSEVLTNIRASSLALPLKHLAVCNCSKMQNIDISAPKLLSLTYSGHAIELNIRNASSLSEVSVGGHQGVDVAYAFKPLFKYFFQLECLRLRMVLDKKHNLGIDDHLPLLRALFSLKHLELCIFASYESSLLEWIPLIQACPKLQNLTLKFEGPDAPWARPKYKRVDLLPLNRLKTLEIVGYYGRRIDDEVAICVLENSVMLEQVILDFKSWCSSSEAEGAVIRARDLEGKLPQGAKLVIK